eukprot:TRINITY_DN7437_c0_g1_i1.p1 TRINITY_DN7437_c0_g1~~TRINITY_DN7437_c0_g1_i1.p1  ORF type:complete len:168 (+),score=33.67 TRINITY_DN7437_c0_g1_i1:1685-2188(+)
MFLASRCFSCFSSEENENLLFSSCNIAHQLWSWHLSIMGSDPPPPLSPSLIWKAIANDGDVNGRKCAAAIFFHAISVLWSLCNDSKHQGKKPSLQRATLLLMDRLKAMATSQPVQSHPLPPHPILVDLGLVSYFFFCSGFGFSNGFCFCLASVFRIFVAVFSLYIGG